MADDFEPMDPSLKPVIDKKSLRWIFVGGKGGVGKTTTSCSLGIQLSKSRAKVLLVSTDPAHNLSDAFGQKFTNKPLLVKGFDNLYCMEVDSTKAAASKFEALDTDAGADGAGALGGLGDLLKDMATSMPGIDEAMGFAELMKQVNSLEYDAVVFDTAPTGHTLRLLAFPDMILRYMDKFRGLQSSFGGLLSSFSSMMGAGAEGMGGMMDKMNEMRALIEVVSATFKNPDLTTFVCVCIPEFLSLYETERLIQELTKADIDASAVVVNQVLFLEEGNPCAKCVARQRMQRKYLDQIADLYDDFHVVVTPLLDEEVRGAPRIEWFSQWLITPYSSAAEAGAEPLSGIGKPKA